MTFIVQTYQFPAGIELTVNTAVDGEEFTVVAEYEPPERGQRTMVEGQLQPDLSANLNITHLFNDEGEDITDRIWDDNILHDLLSANIRQLLNPRNY